MVGRRKKENSSLSLTNVLSNMEKKKKEKKDFE